MKVIYATVLLAAFGMGAYGRCTSDIPIELAIQTNYVDGVTVNAIQPDVAGMPYVNGSGGVVATIHLCDGTGDGDIILSATRPATIDFSKILATTPNTPGWAASGSQINCKTYNICWQFDILDLWYVPAGLSHNDEYEFTTRLGGNGPLFSKLSMLTSLNTDVPLVQNQFTAVANSPAANSPVHVHHCPSGFSGSSTYCVVGQPHESWFVWPDAAATSNQGSVSGFPFTQVATLILNGMKGQHGPEDGGEFSIPFYFIITSLQ